MNVNIFIFYDIIYSYLRNNKYIIYFTINSDGATVAAAITLYHVFLSKFLY